MRSGTVPTALAVGLGAACRIANQEMAVSLLVIDKMVALQFSIITLQPDNSILNPICIILRLCSFLQNNH